MSLLLYGNVLFKVVLYRFQELLAENSYFVNNSKHNIQIFIFILMMLYWSGNEGVDTFKFGILSEG